MWGTGGGEEPAANESRPAEPDRPAPAGQPSSAAATPPPSGQPTDPTPVAPAPGNPPVMPPSGTAPTPPASPPPYPPPTPGTAAQAYPPPSYPPPQQYASPYQPAAAPYAPPYPSAPPYRVAAPATPYPYQAPGPYAAAPGPYSGSPQRRSDPGLPAPVAVQPVPGTPYMLAVVGVAPTTSGRAVASLVAGVGSILVSFVVGCFGALGGEGGWGPKVAGAFALLALFAGVAAVVLGQSALRHIRRRPPADRPRGRGLGLAGLICGATGIGLTVLGFALALSLANLD